MELSLQTYFDIRLSYGLGDSAFERLEGANAPDILGIGLRNPLGLGLRHALHKDSVEVLELWRQQAVLKVDAPEMELGFETPTPEFADAAAIEEFKTELRRFVAVHPIKTCEITIYAVGVVFLRLDFVAGVPLPLANGFRRCFEYAGYYAEVSTALLKVAREVANAHLKRPPSRWWRRNRDIGIQALSRRPEPEIQTDEKGYTESQLLAGFTHLALCVDATDDVEAIKRRLMPRISGSNDPDSEVLHFEYHGTIHFNWATCVIQPRSYEKVGEEPATQIRRMLTCIQIAHTFQGAGEAFQNLFLHETLVLAEGFIRGHRGGLNHIELNRLRTLALAVISLTKFQTVTQTEEDQAYFRAYERNAKLDKLHDTMLSGSAVLLSVQQAEADKEQERRDDNLNTAVIFLTGFTLLSTLWDVYEFLKGEDKGLQAFVMRAETLGGIALLLLLILVIVSRRVIHGTSRRR
jgi:hypothetical protein